MKSKGLSILVTISIFLTFSAWVLYPGGSPGGKTGSPGDGGANCTQCHTGTPQQASDWISSNIPETGYIPGETYTVTATGDHIGVVKFGFELTSEDESGQKMGTLMVTNSGQTRLVNGNKAITHTLTGTTPFGSTKSWTFDWTAPDEGSGPITFYGAFNAANGNGNTSGDVIYLSSTTVDENTSVGTEEFSLSNGLKLFPNPASTFSYLSWEGENNGIKQVLVYDMNGKVVGEYSLADVSNNSLRIDVSGYEKGLYLSRVTFLDGKEKSVSLIKL